VSPKRAPPTHLSTPAAAAPKNVALLRCAIVRPLIPAAPTRVPLASETGIRMTRESAKGHLLLVWGRQTRIQALWPVHYVHPYPQVPVFGCMCDIRAATLPYAGIIERNIVSYHSILIIIMLWKFEKILHAEAVKALLTSRVGLGGPRAE
jgi:hypothetical protein